MAEQLLQRVSIRFSLSVHNRVVPTAIEVNAHDAFSNYLGFKRVPAAGLLEHRLDGSPETLSPMARELAGSAILHV